MIDPEMLARLDRCLAGECTAEEAAAVERWLAADPRRRALMDAMRGGGVAGEWDVDAAWTAVAARAGLRPTAADAPRDAVAPTARRGARAPVWLLRAAVLAAIATAAVVAGRALLAPSATAGAITVTTAEAESDTVMLADGSTVILGARSTLEYAADFGATTRDVRLAGEAYFHVARDSGAAFRVDAGHATVQVVGTEFVVRAYGAGSGSGSERRSGAEPVVVAVAEGAVNVRRAGMAVASGVVLRPGNVARIAQDGAMTVTSNADLDRWLGWVDGRLVFEDAPLPEVLAELERWYGLEFRVEDAALAAKRVTARLRAGSLDETLEALALAVGASHARAGDVITLTPNSP
jgi:ferric-dicitrate binding protein FerR (iron transport regulator)